MESVILRGVFPKAVDIPAVTVVCLLLFTHNFFTIIIIIISLQGFL